MSELLRGKGVVVTRPKEQSAELIALLEAVGAHPIPFPAIHIEAPENWQSLDAALDGLARFRWAIFSSRNAVQFALSRLQGRAQEWPKSVQVAAVGRETARALKDFGLSVDLVPDRFSSEGLLEHPALREVQGVGVAIFAGDQGRELLEHTLSERGALVEKVYCYRRSVPGANPTPLLHAWARGELHAVTVTSPEIFNNFYQMVGGLGQRWLKNTPIVAISPLTAEAVTAKGLPAPWVAPEASNQGLLQALRDWAKHMEDSER
ncbi:MAG: uroporphyrinogen-III synthase [Acidithiobacillus sp.]